MNIVCRNGNVDVMDILLENGADINGKYLGNTHLFTAMTYGKRSIVKILLEAGVNKSITEKISLFSLGYHWK